MTSGIMLDIETLGTRPGCVVLSIGAVEFDDGELSNHFSVHLDPEDAAAHGLLIEPRTVMWWLEQSREAQRALITAKRTPFVRGMMDFVKAFEWKDKPVWVNGASFDFPIVEAALEAAGVPVPWKFWDQRCFRTVKNLYPKVKRVQPELAHDALSDAVAQARTLMEMLK